jgi:hypothetical protein
MIRAVSSLLLSRSCAVAIVLGFLSGCGGAAMPGATSSGEKAGQASGTAPTSAAVSADGASAGKTVEPGAPPRKFESVKIGAAAGGGSASQVNEKAMGSVLEAMQPLQVVLGKWRGVTSKDLEGSKKIEEPEWIWDFRSNKEQPALVVTAAASPFFKSGRLTFLTQSQQFQFQATDKEGTERVYQGAFSEEPKDEPGEDNKLHRTFKLTLRQVNPADDRRLAQVVFAQQQNNRYLMQVYDKRGESVLLVNTVANQREGTSFALNPDDYGEKKCVVSGGLGTSTVSHKGKTYYVCCTGCKAAFEDDPERWIAKFEASQKKPN